MRINLFAKVCNTREGRTFNKYLSRITKSGEEIGVQVKFKNGSDIPVTPCVLEFDKSIASYSEKTTTRTIDGEDKTFVNRTLWLDLKSGTYNRYDYVDNSMDDIE